MVEPTYMYVCEGRFSLSHCSNSSATLSGFLSFGSKTIHLAMSVAMASATKCSAVLEVDVSIASSILEVTATKHERNWFQATCVQEKITNVKCWIPKKKPRTQKVPALRGGGVCKFFLLLKIDTSKTWLATPCEADEHMSGGFSL